MEIRKIEAAIGTRLETGPVQVNQDWPGVFIRGDNAAYYAYCLENYMDENAEPNPMAVFVVRDLLRLLQGCRI